MKVLMYTTNTLYSGKITGGIKRFIELYNGLISQGRDVTLYSADSEESLKEKGVLKYYSISRPKVTKESPLIPNEVLYFLNNIKVLQRIKNEKYDVVIVFDVPTAISLALVNIKNIHLMIRQDLIGYKSIGLEDRIKNKFARYLYLKALHLSELICCIKAKQIIVQCEYDKNLIIDRSGIFKDKVSKKTLVQINNVNASWIKENNKIGKTNKTNSFEIGFIGDFDNERKGHSLLLSVVKKMIDSGFDLRVVLIGSGKQLDYYKNKYSMYDQIQFTGRLTNPYSELINCDLMIVPSIADSCPNTILESLYNNIPVIGSKNGGIPDILVDDDAMFEYTTHSLEEKIKQYLNSEFLMELKGKQLKRRNELTFNWADVMINHLDTGKK